MSRPRRPPRSDAVIADTWRAYFSERCHPDVAALVEDYPDRRSLHVDLVDLYGYDRGFTEDLFDSPGRHLRIATDVFCGGYDAFEYVNVRVVHNPALFQLADLRARHVHELVTVEGVAESVDRVGATAAVAVHECPRCGERVDVRPCGVRLPAPRHCDECGREPLFRPELSTFVDLQRVSTSPSETADCGGMPARRIDVYLADDLVGAVDPGDTFLVTGVVRPERAGRSNRFRLCVDGVTVTEERTTIEDRSLAEVIQSRWESTTGA